MSKQHLPDIPFYGGIITIATLIVSLFLHVTVL